MTPEEYVAVQYRVNHAHMDGRQEHQCEEAILHSRTFATWLKYYRLPVTSFLDAGCRLGYAMESLGKLFPAAQVTGVDIVPQFIEIADMRGTAVVGDLQNLPFEDHEFDWTFSCTAIEHCPNVLKAVQEMQRVSKYGFYVHTDLEDEETSKKNPSHFAHHDTPDGWIDEFRHPEWLMAYEKIKRHNRIEMIWIRKEHRLLLQEQAYTNDIEYV